MTLEFMQLAGRTTRKVKNVRINAPTGPGKEAYLQFAQARKFVHSLKLTNKRSS
jgi:hypothetical protein